MRNDTSLRGACFSLPKRAQLALTVMLFCAGSGGANAAGAIFSTILSGSGQDYANAVVTDSQGNVYVAGETYSKDFPVTPGAYQTTFGQTADAFVAKLGPDGKIIWATFLGGELTDSATGIALDSSGNVWGHRLDWLAGFSAGESHSGHSHRRLRRLRCQA